MRNLIFWGLFPVALPQAVYVRLTAPRYSAPGCDPEGVHGRGRRMRLLAIGDSTIVGVGVDKLADALVGRTTQYIADALDCEIAWSVHGRSGARTQTLLDEFLPALPPDAADVILLSVGVNDVTGLVPQRIWTRNLSRILHRLRRHSPQGVIGVAGLPPLGAFPLLPQPLRFASGQRARAFDVAARDLVAGLPGVLHLPVDFDPAPERFSPDGFHPSAASYDQFGRSFGELICSELTLTGGGPRPIAASKPRPGAVPI